MEVGAVKQAFNNELILLKKKLNQAKIQVIHKLTRKAKTLVEKKAPEPLKEKFKRKAESAVKEVLIIKKIKARDIGKFIVTHSKQLQDHLNKPEPDLDRACARLLLHKSLADKYKLIRNKFSQVPIDDLLMSRQERRKIKKEAKEAQESKNKAKQEKRDQKNKERVRKEGDWEVEDLKTDVKDGIEDKTDNSNGNSDSEKSAQDSDNGSLVSEAVQNDVQIDKPGSGDDQNDIQNDVSDNSSEDQNDDDDDENIDDSGDELDDIQNDEPTDNSSKDQNDDDVSGDETETTKKTKIKLRSGKKVNKIGWEVKELELKPEEESPESEFKLKIGNNLNLPKTKTEKKQKQKNTNTNKNKNLKDKITHKKFSKNSEDSIETQKKTVDPFFITSSGENYMSVAEIRPPDEVKEEHRKGNRQLRRARIFGHALKSKPRSFRNEGQDRQNSFDRRQNGFDRRQNGFDKRQNGFDQRQNGFDRRQNRFDQQNDTENSRFSKNYKFDKERSNFRREDGKPSFKDTRTPNFDKRDDVKGKNNMNKRPFESDSKPEKLHPSWEAKKKLSGIQPFQGKKIVFN